ncbi:MAG: thermonuclease family protein [Deltaproteobacteria bacterium]|nr:thermonuclease family protein [Deltaproteobacteria bacterium]
MKNVFLLLVVFLLTGCVNKVVQANFVVLRDVPDKPSFTIIPFNQYHTQTTFADQIEEVLLQLGVKTFKYKVTPPKTIQKAKSLGTNEATIDLDLNKLFTGGVAAEAIALESYIEYGKIKANYLIYSDIFTGRIKIIKKKDFEILASFIISDEYLTSKAYVREYKFKKILVDSLNAIGLKTRELREKVYANQVVSNNTFLLSANTKVKLIGVSTKGMSAIFLKNLIKGQVLELVFGRNILDEQGNILAYVYAMDGTLINAEIIKEGYGSVDTEVPFKYLKDFQKYEREAQDGKRGLWGVEKKIVRSKK